MKWKEEIDDKETSSVGDQSGKCDSKERNMREN